MKELKKLLKGVDINMNTDFGEITLRNTHPIPIGFDAYLNLLATFNKLMELKNS